MSERNGIVILGRPSSGKSVLLTVLYQQLWESQGDLTLRAGDGNTHASLLSDFSSLMHGQWLPATQAIRQYDLELIYKSRMVPLIVFDYPGELYRQMFFEKRVDTPELKTFYEHIRRALGIILLLDPADLIQEGDAKLDTEYSALQVVEHFTNGRNGDCAPIVLVYTKRDKNAELIQHHGGLLKFTRKYMPRLTKVLGNVPIVHLAAVRTSQDKGGKSVPWAMSSEEQVAIPLRLILRRLDAEEENKSPKRRASFDRFWNRHWRWLVVSTASVFLFLAFFAVGVLLAL